MIEGRAIICAKSCLFAFSIWKQWGAHCTGCSDFGINCLPAIVKSEADTESEKENEDIKSEEDEDFDEVSEYEKIRQKNILERQAMFQVGGYKVPDFNPGPLLAGNKLKFCLVVGKEIELNSGRGTELGKIRHINANGEWREKEFFFYY